MDACGINRSPDDSVCIRERGGAETGVSGMAKKDRVFTAGVVALILLSFILGTSEFIVVGILPDIARNLHRSISTVGTIVSVFAFTYALGTPFLTAFTGNFSRYRLLLLLTVLFIAGNLLSAAAPNYGFLVFSRIVTAMVSGTLISVSMTFSSDVAAPENRGRVVAWIFSGFSIAAVAGVPAGTFLSHLLGWRWAFAAIVAASAGVLFLLAHSLPQTGAIQKTRLVEQLALFRDRRIHLGFFIPMLSAAATYVFYTYLTPLFQNPLGVPARYTGFALLAFGACSIASNLLSGRLATAGGTRLLPAVFLLQTACLALLPLGLLWAPAGFADVCALGVLMYLMNSPILLFYLDTANRDYPGSVTLASAINPVSFNLGISLGSLVGSLAVARLGLRYLGWFGALFGLGAMAAAVGLNRRIARADAGRPVSSDRNIDKTPRA